MGLYKGWAWQPIQDNPGFEPDIAVPVRDLLNDVMDAGGGFGPYELEKLTHSEAPWIRARGGIPIDEPSNAVISLEDMKTFYRQALVGKSRPGTVPSFSKSVPKPPPIRADEVIRFSFKYLDLISNEKFGIHRRGQGYLAKLLERLRDLSGITDGDSRTSRSSAPRAHEIDWSRTSEPAGFRHLNPQLREIKAWQFEITSNAHGRVHGFLIGDTFFTVWIDPAHQLYPGRR